MQRAAKDADVASGRWDRGGNARGGAGGGSWSADGAEGERRDGKTRDEEEDRRARDHGGLNGATHMRWGGWLKRAQRALQTLCPTPKVFHWHCCVALDRSESYADFFCSGRDVLRQVAFYICL